MSLLGTNAGRRTEGADELSETLSALRVSFWPVVCVSLLSAVYFANYLMRAAAKCFWVDELVTVYLCRMPLHDIFVANRHSTDFNPPLFYILTQVAERLFGEGLVATRLPEILGVYLFCLGLFVFVRRRLGYFAGFVAGVFPLFTLAGYYAYEARPHGLTLGWCGLALVFWQQAKSGTRNGWAVAGFYASLTGAVLNHVYAVFIVLPFVAAELYEWWRVRRLDWRMVAAVAAAMITGALFILPLLLGFSKEVAPKNVYPKVPWTAVEPFTKSLLGFGIVIVLLVLAMAGALARSGQPETPQKAWPAMPAREMVLAVTFLCLPILGIQAVRLVHGPFFNRYFLASLAGVSIFLGAAGSVTARRFPRAAALLVAFLVFELLFDFRTVAKARWQHTPLNVVEPTSGFVIGSPQAPLAHDELLLTLQGNEDVLVLRQLDYLYLYNYAPPELSPHLYLGGMNSDDGMLTVHDRVAKWAHVPLKTTTFAPFLAQHSHFYAYGTFSPLEVMPECRNCMEYFLEAGYRLLSVKRDADGVLFEYGK